MTAAAASPGSLRRQLLAVWLLTGVAGLSVSGLLFALHRQSTSVRTTDAAQTLVRACADIAARVAGVQTAGNGTAGGTAAAASAAGAGGQPSAASQPVALPAFTLDRTALFNVVLQLVLANAQGIEGGVWSAAQGHLAYAYPTYAGDVVKTDIPSAERPLIEAVAADALRTGRTAGSERTATRETLLLTACPLDAGHAAWVMTRVPGSATADGRLLAGMVALLAMVAACSGLLGRMLRHWTQSLDALGHALAQAGDGAGQGPSGVPQLPSTRFAELDRLTAAITGYASRLVDARRTGERLAAELGRHERLAALGRLTASVAHEIRNPIATMRLTAENALAAPGASSAQPLQVMLDQIQRLDGVVEGLLTMVQPIRLQPQPVALHGWLHGIAAPLRAGLAPGATLEVDAAAPATWTLDPLHAARIVENLLHNALRHTPAGGRIALQTALDAAGRLQLTVRNTGEPVPAALADQLFEPFVTGRADGTGLGLAQAREVALAHGGTLEHRRDGAFTCFTLTVPAHVRWPTS